MENWSRKCDDKNLSSVGHTIRYRYVKTTISGSRIFKEFGFGFEIRIRTQLQIQVKIIRLKKKSNFLNSKMQYLVFCTLKHEIYSLFSFLWSYLPLLIPNPDPDPLTQMNPDPIRIRIRNTENNNSRVNPPAPPPLKLGTTYPTLPLDSLWSGQWYCTFE
jgi:hypothetical protein